MAWSRCHRAPLLSTGMSTDVESTVNPLARAFQAAVGKVHPRVPDRGAGLRSDAGTGPGDAVVNGGGPYTSRPAPCNSEPVPPPALLARVVRRSASDRTGRVGWRDRWSGDRGCRPSGQRARSASVARELDSAVRSPDPTHRRSVVPAGNAPHASPGHAVPGAVPRWTWWDVTVPCAPRRPREGPSP
jgi:hypothetical protein